MMKVKAILIIAFSAVSISCNSIFQDQKKCEGMVCTQEFAMVNITFRNAAGQAIDVNDFSAVFKKSGKPTKGSEYRDSHSTGVYTLASDSDKNELSTKGDIILVSGTDPASNQRKTAEVVVSGGVCVCHIAKKSGPVEMFLIRRI